MKILTGIIILQFAAILLLYGKLTNIEQAMVDPAPMHPETALTGNPLPSPQAPVAPAAQDEDRLRQIIREELAAQLGQQAGPTATGDPMIVADARDPAEIERQREQVFQQLEYFTSVGRISDMEMAQLQREIAKLDAAYRTEALKELTKALNSGRLEGRL